ncbi:hypothetical protein JCM33374_g1401 [Metschnikowia sp. JCM 33374]|nr:hypothetical protein JCM33374_g1401 [Metschnikowia sp. JCM 33374]
MQKNALASLNHTHNNSQGLYVENLLPEYYFYEKEGGKLSLVVVLPEDSSGNELARFMQQEASKSKEKYGFEPATNLFKNTLRTVVSREFHWDARMSIVYITRDGDFLEILSAGNIWAGLFRGGHLVNCTGNDQARTLGEEGPDGFISKLSMVHSLSFQNWTQNWSTQNGDLLVITGADTHHSLKEIIEIAMDTAHISGAPVSQILSNVHPYLNSGQVKAKMMAVIQFS